MINLDKYLGLPHVDHNLEATEPEVQRVLEYYHQHFTQLRHIMDVSLLHDKIEELAHQIVVNKKHALRPLVKYLLTQMTNGNHKKPNKVVQPKRKKGQD
jgi:hypothetical protein